MECEIKLTAPAAQTLRLVLDDDIITKNMVGEREHIAMHSVYYDFIDQSLGKEGISLRFRTENGIGRVTLKAKSECGPAGIKIRNEWEAPCKSLCEGLACLNTGTAVDALLARARLGELFVTAEVSFSRTIALTRISGALIEFALDEGCFNGDTDKCFAELEAELKSGRLDELAAVSAHLAAKYSLKVENNSKLARALALRTGFLYR